MNILLAISGGIAAYKMLTVIRLLVKEGHRVRTVLTPHALEFITPLSIKSLSGEEVYCRDFELDHPIAHIELADWAEVIAVAPATANTLAKLAHGLADNLLTSTVLAATCRKVVFPAMNVHMLQNPQTQQNLAHLQEAGIEVIQPASGDLACGYSGQGRLPDEDTVAAVIACDPHRPLKGRHYLVTAGATRESLDPVRYISNHSSGRMGLALARELFRRGAQVTLIHGAMEVQAPEFLHSIQVESTRDMLNEIDHLIGGAQGLIMAAAPADYQPAQAQSQKIKKQDTLNLELIATPDILSALVPRYPGKLYLGFALETEQGQHYAQSKLQAKNLDYIVLNQVSPDFNPMGSLQNQVTLISRSGKTVSSPMAPKSEIAAFILDTVFESESAL